jgi:hypothetical protein
VSGGVTQVRYVIFVLPRQARKSKSLTCGSFISVSKRWACVLTSTTASSAPALCSGEPTGAQTHQTHPSRWAPSEGDINRKQVGDGSRDMLINKTSREVQGQNKILDLGRLKIWQNAGEGFQGEPDYPIFKIRRVESGGCGIGGRKDV